MEQTKSRRLLIVLMTICLAATACGSSGGGGAQSSKVEVDDTPGWPEKRPPPDPWTIFSHDAPADVPVIETQATGDDQLRMMFSDSVEFVATDPRALDQDFTNLFEQDAAEQAPDLYLAGLASRLSQSADANAIVEAHARAGLAGDFGPGYDTAFESLLATAEQFRSSNLSLYDLVQRSRGLSMIDRRCLADTIRSSYGSCGHEMQELVEEAESLREIAIDMPALTPLGRSVCSLWLDVRPDITPEQLPLARARLAGTPFDRWILGWQECAFTDASGEQFSAPELEIAGAAALRPVFDGVVAAALSPDLDIEFDSINGPEWKVAQRTVSVVVADAASTRAQFELASVTDPETRFVLVSLAYATSLEAWYQRTAIDGGFDDPETSGNGVAGIAPCVAYGGYEPATECDESERVAADALAVLEPSALKAGVVAPLTLIDWETIGPEVGHCEAWNAALAAVSPAEQERVGEILVRNDIGQLFGIERC